MGFLELLFQVKIVDAREHTMKGLSCDLLSRFRSGSEFWVNTHILELKSSQLTATNCSFLSHEGTAGNDRGGAEIVKSFLDLCTLFFCHAPAMSSAPSRLTLLWMTTTRRFPAPAPPL